MNAASIEAALPTPNVATVSSPSTSAMLAPPNRSLLGFLSLLNGILEPTEVSGHSLASAKKSAGRLQTIPGRLDGQPPIVPAFAELLPLLSPGPIVHSPTRPFEGTTHGSSIASTVPLLAGPLPLAAPTDEPATDVAFALHLTPQSVIGRSPAPWALSVLETKSSGVLAADTRQDDDISKGVSGSAKAAPRLDFTIAETISPIKLSATSESASTQAILAISAPQSSIASLSEVGLAHATPEGQYSPQDFVQPPEAQKVDAPVANPVSPAVVDVTRKLPKASTYAQATRDSLGRQSLPLGESAMPRSPDGASLERPPERGPGGLTTLGEGDVKQFAVIRHAPLNVDGSTSDKTGAVAPKQQEGSQEERNNSDRGSKVFKLDGAGKSTANQKEFHGESSNLLAGGSPAQMNGQGRISSRTQPTVDALTSGRPSLETEPALSLRPQPIREISLKLTDEASTKVEIQVLERAGNLHVAVRTPDQELTKSLQANLGELVGHFETKGYRTETWIPAANLHASSQLTETTSNSGHSQDQSEHAGSWSGQQQQQQSQHESDQRQHPRWMASVEEMLDEENASTSGFRMENP